MKCIQDLKISTVAVGDEIFPRHSEATVLECQDGTFKIAWQRFENSEHGSNDTSPATIVMMDSVGTDPHSGWENLRVAADRISGCVNVYSPCLIRRLDGKVLFLYMRYDQLYPGEPSFSSGYCKISEDDGETFGEERVLWERQPCMYINDSVRRLKSGRLLWPMVRQLGKLWTSEQHLSIFTMYSDDDGETWERSEHIVDLPMRGAMEPFVAECADGSICMVMRSQLGSVMRCYSYDAGITWTKPQTTGLRTPECCAFITNIEGSDTLMMVWNNAEYDPSYASHFGKRTPLTVAFSDDGGKTFYNFTDLETDPNCVFSNFAVTWAKDGRCVLTYWTTRYLPSGRMGGTIDLKLATFKIGDC